LFYLCMVHVVFVFVKTPLFKHKLMFSVSVFKHACQHCGKVLPSKAHLQMHLRVHTGEMPYTCKFCGKGFTQKGNMARHIMNVHKVVIDSWNNAVDFIFRAGHGKQWQQMTLLCFESNACWKCLCVCWLNH